MKLRADRRVGILMAGVILAVFLALGATVVLPATDPDLQVDPYEMTEDELRGMDIYRTEGCWYCHTNYLRSNRPDAALGTPLGPEAYAGRSPAMLGLERVGPDLVHYAQLQPSAEAITSFLASGESHPPYAYLSTADLEALAQYLLSLR